MICCYPVDYCANVSKVKFNIVPVVPMGAKHYQLKGTTITLLHYTGRILAIGHLELKLVATETMYKISKLSRQQVCPFSSYHNFINSIFNDE